MQVKSQQAAEFVVCWLVIDLAFWPSHLPAAQYFDLDKDGCLSREEFAAFHADLVAHEYAVPRAVDDCLAALDRNRDGLIRYTNLRFSFHGHV